MVRHVQGDHLSHYHFACSYVEGKAVPAIACGYGAEVLRSANYRSGTAFDINLALVQRTWVEKEVFIYFEAIEHIGHQQQVPR